MAIDGSALVCSLFLSLWDSVSSSFGLEPLLRLDLLDSKLSTDFGRGRVSVMLLSVILCALRKL